MATTLLPAYTGTATITPDGVAEIIEALASAQGDADKADDPEDSSYYQGLVDAYIEVLNLLHGLPGTPYPKDIED